MKVLAILALTPDAQFETVRAELDGELGGSWAPYGSGVLREAYVTEDPNKVVCVLETSDGEAAKQMTPALPLVGSASGSLSGLPVLLAWR